MVAAPGTRRATAARACSTTQASATGPAAPATMELGRYAGESAPLTLRITAGLVIKERRSSRSTEKERAARISPRGARPSSRLQRHQRDRDQGGIMDLLHIPPGVYA